MRTKTKQTGWKWVFSMFLFIGMTCIVGIPVSADTDLEHIGISLKDSFLSFEDAINNNKNIISMPQSRPKNYDEFDQIKNKWVIVEDTDAGLNFTEEYDRIFSNFTMQQEDYSNWMVDYTSENWKYPDSYTVVEEIVGSKKGRMILDRVTLQYYKANGDTQSGIYPETARVATLSDFIQAGGLNKWHESKGKDELISNFINLPQSNPTVWNRMKNIPVLYSLGEVDLTEHLIEMYVLINDVTGSSINVPETYLDKLRHQTILFPEKLFVNQFYVEGGMYDYGFQLDQFPIITNPCSQVVDDSGDNLQFINTDPWNWFRNLEFPKDEFFTALDKYTSIIDGLEPFTIEEKEKIYDVLTETLPKNRMDIFSVYDMKWFSEKIDFMAWAKSRGAYYSKELLDKLYTNQCGRKPKSILSMDDYEIYLYMDVLTIDMYTYTEGSLKEQYPVGNSDLSDEYYHFEQSVYNGTYQGEIPFPALWHYEGYLGFEFTTPYKIQTPERAKMKLENYSASYDLDYQHLNEIVQTYAKMKSIEKIDGYSDILSLQRGYLIQDYTETVDRLYRLNAQAREQGFEYKIDVNYVDYESKQSVKQDTFYLEDGAQWNAEIPEGYVPVGEFGLEWKEIHTPIIDTTKSDWTVYVGQKKDIHINYVLATDESSVIGTENTSLLTNDEYYVQHVPEGYVAVKKDTFGVWNPLTNVKVDGSHTVWTIYVLPWSNFVGKDGEDGEKGEPGDKGDTGEKGEPGDKGDTGEKGDAGDKGDKGDTGDAGKDGVDGKDGADGKDGTNGLDGKDGEKGETGEAGKDGVNGTNGVDGKDGVNGTNGVDGKDGKDGTNGTNGKDGERTPTLPDTMDSSTASPTPTPVTVHNYVSPTPTASATYPTASTQGTLPSTMESKNNLPTTGEVTEKGIVTLGVTLLLTLGLFTMKGKKETVE